jgi:hypothetical protein
MTKRASRRASAKTLLGRRLKPNDFPFVIRRKRWIDWLTGCVLVAVCLALAGGSLWLSWALPLELELGWAKLFCALFGVLLLTGAYVGIDNIGYHLVVDSDGITLRGRLSQRQVFWSEITHYATWRGRAVTGDGIFFLGFYQAVIHVDGSNNPKRLARNIFFAGHFAPPVMEIGGKEIIKLLAKAQRYFENGSPAPAAGA